MEVSPPLPESSGEKTEFSPRRRCNAQRASGLTACRIRQHHLNYFIRYCSFWQLIAGGCFYLGTTDGRTFSATKSWAKRVLLLVQPKGKWQAPDLRNRQPVLGRELTMCDKAEQEQPKIHPPNQLAYLQQLRSPLHREAVHIHPVCRQLWSSHAMDCCSDEDLECHRIIHC